MEANKNMVTITETRLHELLDREEHYLEHLRQNTLDGGNWPYGNSPEWYINEWKWRPINPLTENEELQRLYFIGQAVDTLKGKLDTAEGLLKKNASGKEIDDAEIKHLAARLAKADALIMRIQQKCNSSDSRSTILDFVKAVIKDYFEFVALANDKE